jgi:tagatose-1,6-bisphosphate aldolase non-catalytic subunit AgaZ/GatZ
MSCPEQLLAVVEANQRGAGTGISSICSSNPFVLKVAAQQAVRDQCPLLVESTANQVNQGPVAEFARSDDVVRGR